ncbi:GCN5 family acetyltransferase [Gordoniibacillus kamchatkensis]|uniref:GCN5 family acetyltransferase n=1 Tax=Gordoniibacillus kamchatkensis TaxID=1590651 RepID=A0ABR5AKF7_9BACL|nr:GNAT family N-acetyltransferase [Paenibacillus sp. VKM B-2647]KIL41333.1 GCN5 family acetyltransferase [Paenibacillus sp. VKM B-2647]
MYIREACIEDAEKIAKVHVDSWKSTYQGIISEYYLSSLSVEKRLKSWLWTFENLEIHQKIFVAEDTPGNIVGFSSGGRSRNNEFKHDGELYAIYLLKDYQRLGLGKMLFTSIVRSLKDSGYSAMMLWVLKDNPSVEFYKLQGGQIIGQKEITIGSDRLIELAIGWDRM